MKVNFGLDSKKIHDLSQYLEKALANTYALYINTLNCHWNLEDPRFLFLHEMLQEQYEELAKSGDEIAERIRQMGVKVSASLPYFAKQAEIEPLPEKLSGDQMIAVLAESHEKIIRDFRTLSEIAEEHKDYGLVDMLGGLLRYHEKTAWFLRSHL